MADTDGVSIRLTILTAIFLHVEGFDFDLDEKTTTNRLTPHSPAPLWGGWHFAGSGARQMTVNDLVAYLSSLDGATIRGRVVNHVIMSLYADGSGQIVVETRQRRQCPEDRLLSDVASGQSVELVAHIDDIRTCDVRSLVWQYWDESADGEQRRLSL